MRVTLASALRTLRMRPAATWVQHDQSPLLAQRKKVPGTDLSSSHHEDSFIANLPSEDQ